MPPVEAAKASEASDEADLVPWSARRAWLLREGRLGERDVAHPAEEVEGVDGCCRGEIESRLTVLIPHLLRWMSQPGYRSESWDATLTEQRRPIARVIRRAPNLRSCPRGVLPDRHLSARRRETGVNLTTFSATAPFTSAEVPDRDSLSIEPDRETRG